MKNTLHFSLQNEIWLTTVVAGKWGPPRSSTCPTESSWATRVPQGRVPHRGQQSGSELPAATRPGPREARAARASSTCCCLRLRFSESNVTTEIRSQFDSHFWVSTRAATPPSGTSADVATGSIIQPLFTSPFVLCVGLT